MIETEPPSRAPQHRAIGVLFAWVTVASCFGCFDPTVPVGLECSPRDRCPDGQACGTDGLCHLDTPPITDDGAIRLDVSPGLFDVIGTSDGFVIAVDTGQVTFFHVSGASVEEQGNTPADGEVTFLSLEAETEMSGYLVLRDDRGLQRSRLTFGTATVKAFGGPIPGDLSLIAASSVGTPALSALLGLCFFQDGALRFLTTAGGDETLPSDVPTFTTLALTSFGFLALYQQAGTTHYWRPAAGTDETGTLASNLTSVTLFDKHETINALAATHGDDNGGYVHLLTYSPLELTPGTRFDLGEGTIDVASPLQVAEGPFLEETGFGDSGTEFGLSYRVVTDDGIGDLYVARPQHRTGKGFATVAPSPLRITTASDHDVGTRHRIAFNPSLNQYLVVWEDTRQGETGIYFRSIAAN